METLRLTPGHRGPIVDRGGGKSLRDGQSNESNESIGYAMQSHHQIRVMEAY